MTIGSIALMFLLIGILLGVKIEQLTWLRHADRGIPYRNREKWYYVTSSAVLLHMMQHYSRTVADGGRKPSEGRFASTVRNLHVN